MAARRKQVMVASKLGGVGLLPPTNREQQVFFLPLCRGIETLKFLKGEISGVKGGAEAKFFKETSKIGSS